MYLALLIIIACAIWGWVTWLGRVSFKTLQVLAALAAIYVGFIHYKNSIRPAEPKAPQIEISIGDNALAHLLLNICPAKASLPKRSRVA